jgi:hypothetical protein
MDIGLEWIFGLTNPAQSGSIPCMKTTASTLIPDELWISQLFGMAAQRAYIHTIQVSPGWASAHGLRIVHPGRPATSPDMPV